MAGLQAVLKRLCGDNGDGSILFEEPAADTETIFRLHRDSDGVA